MADPAKAAGGSLTHILNGTSGFMWNPDLLHALKFKDEWAITPEQLELLTPHMQRIVKGMGARTKGWTDKEREAFKRKRSPEAEVEAEPEPKRKAKKDEAE